MKIMGKNGKEGFSIMRLLEFLDKELPDLKSDCGKFLKEIRDGRHGFLYRGHSGLQIKTYKKFASRVESGRKPMSTNSVMHNYLNQKFKVMFGWNVRDGVFAAASTDAAGFYGMEFLFFPIGDYKYVWSPSIQDLFARLPGGQFIPGKEQYQKDQIDKLLPSYKDTGLLDAIINVRYINNEISFHCQHYYFINPEYETELRKELTT
jgi:hypothetical protein